jgi:hypothetical protein
MQVRAEGRTRVLALSDTPPERTSLLAGAEMDALSQIRRLYTCLDISVFCAGLNINLVKSATGWSEGSEILSMHVDEVQVTKHGGSDQTEVSIFHVQVRDRGNTIADFWLLRFVFALSPEIGR